MDPGLKAAEASTKPNVSAGFYIAPIDSKSNDGQSLEPIGD